MLLLFNLFQVFMEPLKKIQVEGFAMFAEPELLFGNLDELCCVSEYDVNIPNGRSFLPTDCHFGTTYILCG